MIMLRKLYQLLKDQGFRLPREHGLTIIWTGASSLGVGISIMNNSDIIGLIFSMFFATSILFSADSLMKQAKNPSKEIQCLPILLIAVTAVIMLLWTSLRVELVFMLSIIGILSVGWIFFSYRTKQVNPMELVLGSVSIGLLSLVIFLASVKSISPILLQQGIVIVWAFIGVAIAHIQYVETLRDKLSIKPFFLTWILFLGSLFIPISLSIVTIFIFLPLIEPTIYVLLQTYQQERLKNSRRKIKTIGFRLMFRLWLVVVLMLMLYPLIISS